MSDGAGGIGIRYVAEPAAVDRLFAGGTVLCDGAMGTMLYARGVFINRSYDELNLSQPELVREVHAEYLQAGAEVVETNTFGANRFRLEHFGIQDKVREINLAGVKLARECVDQIREKQASEAFVAGSIGPLGVRLEPLGKVGLDEARDAFAEQIRAMAEGGPGVGVDLLMIETMTSLSESKQAIRAARSEAPWLPVVVMVTVDEEGNCLDGASAETAANKLTEWGADAIGCNCSAGPATVLSVIERMRKVTPLPLAAMPNAGIPRAVEGRTLYLTSPEYMASFTRKLVKAGATFVGGCCGTTPSYTRAMKSALRALGAMETGAQVMESGDSAAAAVVKNKVEPPPLAQRSKIGSMVAAGEFVTMVEIVPPKGIDCSKEVNGAAELHRLGVDAINVPDSPRASARMSAQSLCVQIQQNVGIETILHYTCRDRNVLSIQSDLLGASSIGLKNVLCLTGDPPKLGNYPDATAVFDVDAIGLVNIVRNLNCGLDIGKNSIGESTGFTVAVAANPGVPDIDQEVRRFAYKVEAGAEYAITQPVFDLRLLEAFLKRIEGFRIPVIAGIWPLTNLRNAEFMKNDLRVSMPEEIMVRMAAATSPEAARAEGVKIAQEMLAEARPMVQGVQVSAPFGKYAAAAQVLGLVEVGVV
ncbi:bifunctional homocysteine S-methyltransferase/methylenetetrahydrofolate reductase [Edaphobacter dinghuensis]|uniref:Bifunctional homocysteine S-methyltransferase/methylenetetrahydrofolate reductase n=1 Tax=Edaphobacter dinghuensis TaxID=1560005 RepID=A0A917HEN3_9BACT|nr:bifunctional homocysteine S-methyltransferase/methylenetetrahydrofolate reductase [Edaphobacter dinghuensis]GGG76449.1 bifunctional homocysteine S-methyltransferase/methylenetetrahydrofolate reductase [Edaphobacter dinghuensis]